MKPVYPEVDHMELDKDGGYYCRHVAAMTDEGLHKKSDIAGQLGDRDRAIDRLTAERDVLARRLEKLDTLLRKPDVGIFEALDHHGPAEGLLEFVEGLWYTPEGSYLNLDDALEALVP